MSKIIFTFFIICVAYCCDAQSKDTIVINNVIWADNGVCKQCTDLVWHGDDYFDKIKQQQSIIQNCDSLDYYKKRCNTLYGKLWEQNIRINRIKTYWILYRKNPKRYLPFLNSWISRPLQ